MYVISKDDNKEQLQKVLLAVKEELADERCCDDADVELNAVVAELAVHISDQAEASKRCENQSGKSPFFPGRYVYAYVRMCRYMHVSAF